ncbi:hypothetical protein DENSPDRAFT_86044 [Dentipellis sp. KUC8613]|nr:hypothetical protein DENSPDRAFT_86044 [Dentipellis sp. KUC8613]
MSYHPHATIHDQQNSSSAQYTVTAAGQDNISSLASFQDSVERWRNVNYDDVVLPSRAQLYQEICEARLARDQGRISSIQYNDVLCNCMLMGHARLDRAVLGLRDLIRGDRGPELMKRNFDLTDKEVDESHKQALREIGMQMENERRNEQARHRRMITRGI